jgi:drug/metabolite transporter (DMT)-like permease
MIERLNPDNENKALLCGLSAVLLWSTVATGFKLGLEVLAIEQLLLIGSAISWLVFLGYAAITNSWRIARGDRWLTIGLGVINPFAYYLILFGAYDRLPAHIAQPLNYTWAITLALLAVPILKQPLEKRTLIGIVISYAGVVVLLSTAEQTGNSAWNGLGVGLALGSTILWAVYWLLNTKCSSAPAALMFWSFTVGLVLVALACIGGPGLPDLNQQTLAYGAWVGLIEMGITFLLWQQALRLTANAARIGQLIFLSPFVSLVIIYFVLDEHITWGVVVALLVIVLGLRVARPAPSG